MILHGGKLSGYFVVSYLRRGAMVVLIEQERSKGSGSGSGPDCGWQDVDARFRLQHETTTTGKSLQNKNIIVVSCYLQGNLSVRLLMTTKEKCLFLVVVVPPSTFITQKGLT